jgi:hypothetical protein
MKLRYIAFLALVLFNACKKPVESSGSTTPPPVTPPPGGTPPAFTSTAAYFVCNCYYMLFRNAYEGCASKVVVYFFRN